MPKQWVLSPSTLPAEEKPELVKRHGAVFRDRMVRFGRGPWEYPFPAESKNIRTVVGSQ